MTGGVLALHTRPIPVAFNRVGPPPGGRWRADVPCRLSPAGTRHRRVVSRLRLGWAWVVPFRANDRRSKQS